MYYIACIVYLLENYINFCNPNKRPDNFDRTCYVSFLLLNLIDLKIIRRRVLVGFMCVGIVDFWLLNIRQKYENKKKKWNTCRRLLPIILFRSYTYVKQRGFLNISFFSCFLYIIARTNNKKLTFLRLLKKKNI